MRGFVASAGASLGMTISSTLSRSSAARIQTGFFAQALFGYERASSDPRVVAVNFVQAEDDYTSISDYALQMRMVGFLPASSPACRLMCTLG
ncbi:MAG: hypothetical protein WB662_10860 [Methyloceanibacter sp.]